MVIPSNNYSGTTIDGSLTMVITTIHNCFTHINHHENHHNNVGKW